MKVLSGAIFLVLAALAAVAACALSGALLWLCEGLIAVAVIAVAMLYIRIVVPATALSRGIDLLKSQDFSSRLRPVGQADADGIVATFNMLLRQLKDERIRLREQNDFLRQISLASPMGIVIFDYDGRICSLNPSAEALLGADSVSRKLEDCSSPLAEALSGISQGETVTLRLADGCIYRCSRMAMLDMGFQRTFILIEPLTEELMRAERDAYGKLIRTISHEVNNTMAGLMPLFDMLVATTDDAEMAEALQSCSDRCESLTHFIGGYASVVRLPEPRLMPCSLNDLVRRMIPFLESMASGRNIDIVTDFTDAYTTIDADAVMLEQVIVNIVKNSIESIDRNGRVLIKTEAAGGKVSLTVTDNGRGISAEASGSIFAPFFTTKAGGRGLGLTLVAEVLRRHRCSFNLATGSDSLTRFTVTFA